MYSIDKYCKWKYWTYLRWLLYLAKWINSLWHFTPDCIMWIYPYSFQNIIIVSPQKLCVLIHSNLSGRENISLDHKGKKMCPNWLRLWHLKEVSLVILQLCSFWILNIVHVDSSFVKRQFNYISDLRNKWYSKQTSYSWVHSFAFVGNILFSFR